MISTMRSNDAARDQVAGSRPVWLAITLCWLIVVLDGYDLIVHGTTLPLIMKEPWHLTATSVDVLGSLVFVGALFGALGAGDVADRLGRRRAILVCGLIFTVAVAFAPDREIFGLFRLLAGVGLGGLVPSANAITAEFVHVRHRSIVSTIMMSGIPTGSDRRWELPTGTQPIGVSGPLPAVVGWLAGRDHDDLTTTDPAVPVPDLGPWL